MNEVSAIVKSVSEGKVSPVYFLTGNEFYYIDKLSAFFAEAILSEEERGFNQMVLYGADVSVDEIMASAKRFPMMAEKQVVIIKEAQHLSRTIENLSRYVENPMESTVLVICYSHDKGLDKRKSLYKAIKKNGVYFESKKLYENQVGDWIRRVLKGSNYTISTKATAMLVDYLGNDLGKISNELDKLKIILKEGTEITPEIIEEHIGLSKDFNNFELRKAIGEGNVVKANQIIRYFSQNPKDNPVVVTISLLFNFFSQLLKYHGLSNPSPNVVARELGVNPYFVNEYKMAAKRYSMKKVSTIINQIKQIDLKSKGVNSNALSHEDLLKELLVKIMY